MVDSFALPTLLIISDNPSIRYWLKKQLDAKFSLIEATTHGRAIEAALHSSLHAIILDEAFKSCEFLKLTNEIRQTPSNLLTPILLITDKLKKSFRTAATDAGVTDFLFQPLDADELETKIAAIKKAGDVRTKVLGLSARISAPKQSASSSFFKDKVVLHDQALELLSDARKKSIPVKMVIVRIDRFTELSAKLGPLASQEILQNFAGLLIRSSGNNSTVTPFTDGQFIILFSSLDLTESQKIAEHLRKLVEKQRFTTKQGILHLTASFAISDIDPTEKSFNKMIDATTKSLEQSSSLNNKVFFIDKKDA